MTLEVDLDSSEDLLSRFTSWALETGLWNGIPITWKEAPHFQTQVETRIVEMLFSQEPSSIGFQQLATHLAWVGADSSNRTLLDKKIEELRALSNGAVLEVKHGSISTFWKHHKIAIIIGIIVVAIVTTAVVIAACSAGAAGGAAAAAGAAAINHLKKEPEPSPNPSSKPANPQLPKENTNLLTSQPLGQTTFLENGIIANGQFFSYQDLGDSNRQRQFVTFLQNSLTSSFPQTPQSNPSYFDSFLYTFKQERPSPSIQDPTNSIFQNMIPEAPRSPQNPIVDLNIAKSAIDTKTIDSASNLNGKTLFLEHGVMTDGYFISYKEIQERARIEELALLQKKNATAPFRPSHQEPSLIPGMIQQGLQDFQASSPDPNVSDKSFLREFFETIGRGMIEPELLDPNAPSLEIERSRCFSTPGIQHKHMCIMGINGMNTSVEGSTHLASYVAGFTPDMSISWVYNNSHGAVTDLLEIFALNYLGISPNTEPLLQEKWTAFHKANKDNPHAKLLQYCHSQGAIHVRNALGSLSKEIRDRVIVVAIAPAAIIPKSLCYQSFNYASKNDIVPYGEMVFVGSMDSSEFGISKRTENVLELRKQLILLDPHPDVKGIDHDLQSPTFYSTIKYHAKDYILHNGEYE